MNPRNKKLPKIIIFKFFSYNNVAGSVDEKVKNYNLGNFLFRGLSPRREGNGCPSDAT